MHSDPIADMLTRIRNGMAARHNKVDIPGSKVKIEMARILKEEGYVANYRVANDDRKQVLKVYLKYRPDRRPVITRLARVSKPGRRVYVDSKHVPRVIGGMGVCILTTSRGVMTGRQARKKGVGGEVLCTVY
ncbi:MAG: 30S ribosomal protein S8 [Bryobacterales bacterium]|nr:30S ribosomal protein S8 [Bryobacterales bacterium]MDE0625497.1 30S ribosomal protein S8 [Bryobacterales bacterium]